MVDERPVSPMHTRSFEDYLRELKLYGDVPKDQFGHQYKLLWHPSIDINKDTKRRDLFNPDILLGNIKDSKTLYFFQRDFNLLHRFYDMGLRSPGVMDLFDNIFYSWEGSLRMTGALGGTERQLQSFLEPLQAPFESFTYLEKRRMEKEQKKRLKDYIPMGRGGGGGGRGGGNYE